LATLVLRAPEKIGDVHTISGVSNTSVLDVVRVSGVGERVVLRVGGAGLCDFRQVAESDVLSHRLGLHDEGVVVARVDVVLGTGDASLCNFRQVAKGNVFGHCFSGIATTATLITLLYYTILNLFV
jgi:hypothetical protein